MRIAMKNFLLGTALAVGLLGTGAVANAQAREFRGAGHEPARGFERGYGRGYERPVVRGYGYRGGYGVAVGVPVYGGYVPPCPGDGYVWLNGAWVFRGRPGFAVGYRREFERGYGRDFDRDDRRFDRRRGFERDRR